MLNTSKTSMYRIYQKYERGILQGVERKVLSRRGRTISQQVKIIRKKPLNELSQQQGTQKYISKNVWRLQKYRRCTCIN